MKQAGLWMSGQPVFWSRTTDNQLLTSLGKVTVDKNLLLRMGSMLYGSCLKNLKETGLSGEELTAHDHHPRVSVQLLAAV